MCIVSNWVNEAQDLMAVTKYDDLPNSLIPNAHGEGCWWMPEPGQHNKWCRANICRQHVDCLHLQCGGGSGDT